MKRWVYAENGVLCGGTCEDGRIKAGKPMLRITIPGVNRTKFRCEKCAGEPVNLEHLEEAAKLRIPIEPVKPQAFTRLSNVKAPLPFDARMAQTGEKE